MSQDSGRGYPLTTLFLLIAAAAVVLAMLSPLIRHFDRLGVGGEEVAASVVLAVLGMMATGALLGLMQYSRLLGAIWGVLVGALLGLVVGPVIFIPPDMFSIVLATAIGGSILMIVISTSISLFTVPKKAVSSQTLPDDRPAKRKRHPLDHDPEDD